MSQLTTQPVLTCKRCGKKVKLADLHTTQSDPSSEQLWKFFKAIAADALCDYCRGQLAYLNKEHRSEEFYGRK